jgi:hypothetical protein
LAFEGVEEESLSNNDGEAGLKGHTPLDDLAAIYENSDVVIGALRSGFECCFQGGVYLQQITVALINLAVSRYLSPCTYIVGSSCK